jgi:uncharacterized membrane-anchored protein YitT (DUF2179 family)
VKTNTLLRHLGLMAAVALGILAAIGLGCLERVEVAVGVADALAQLQRMLPLALGKILLELL